MNSKAVVRPAIVLLLISAVAAGLLGVVSEVTKAPIAAQAEKTLSKQMMLNSQAQSQVFTKLTMAALF